MGFVNFFQNEILSSGGLVSSQIRETDTFDSCLISAPVNPRKTDGICQHYHIHDWAEHIEPIFKHNKAHVFEFAVIPNLIYSGVTPIFYFFL